MTFEEIVNHIGIKPYYQDEWCAIYHADCRDILPLIPDKSIDLVLTDPPYGVGIDFGVYKDTPENWRDLMKLIIPELKRLAECVIMPCSRIVELPFIYSNFPPDWLLCWYKGATPQRSWVGFNDWEPHLVYGKVKGTQYHDYFLAIPKPRDGSHPTPKPDKWGLYIISKASLQNNLVLDPFLGSGTTCYCAKKLNRYSIGIEIEEKYCEIAAKRCSQSVMRLNIG